MNTETEKLTKNLLGSLMIVFNMDKITIDKYDLGQNPVLNLANRPQHTLDNKQLRIA